MNLDDDPAVIRNNRYWGWRVLAGVSSGAIRTVASRAAAAVGAMMTAHLNAVVHAAGCHMSHDWQRHHAYRRYGDEQTTKRVGERFHGTTTILSYVGKPTLISASKSGATLIRVNMT